MCVCACAVRHCVMYVCEVGCPMLCVRECVYVKSRALYSVCV